MQTAEHQRGRSYRWVGWVLLILAFVSTALLIDEAISRGRLNRALAQTKHIGGALTMTELEDARKQWRADQDAGPVFQQIVAAYPQVFGNPAAPMRKELPIVGAVDSPEPGELLPADQQMAIADFLKTQAGLMDRLAGLSRYPGGSLPIKHNPLAIMTLLPNYSNLRDAARLEALSLLNDSVVNPRKSVLNHVRVMMNEASLTADQPFLISALVSHAIDTLMIDELTRVLSLDAIPPDELPIIQDLLGQIHPYRELEHGLHGENTCFIQSGIYLQKNGFSAFPPLSGAQYLPVMHANWLRDFAAGVAICNKREEAIPRPYDLMTVLPQTDAEITALPSLYVFTKTTMGTLTHAVEVTFRCEAQIRTAIIALGAERYRLAKGAFPESLDALDAAYLPAQGGDLRFGPLTQDPFTRQPLKYKRDQHSITIYSLGIDGLDDGGDVLARRPQRRQPNDTGVVVLSPERRRVVPASQPATAASDRSKNRSSSSGPSRFR